MLYLDSEEARTESYTVLTEPEKGHSKSSRVETGNIVTSELGFRLIHTCLALYSSWS